MFTRREFLSGSAAAAGWMSAGALLPQVRSSLSAGEPAGFRYAMCNETFASWTQPRIFRFLGQCGYGGVEIAPYTIHPDVRQVPAKEREALRQAAEEAGVQIVALHWLLAKTEGLHLTHPERQIRDRTADYLGELARFCRALGGRIMVFGSPKQRDLLPGVSREQGLENAADVIRRVLPVLAECGVTLAIEPLSRGTTNFLITAAEAVELLERIDSPHCQLLLDCLAMASESTPSPELIRRYGRRLVHFHANDPNRRGPGMGDLDFLPILQALADVAYRGWISVEVFDDSPGAEKIARDSIAYLRKMAAQLAG